MLKLYCDKYNVCDYNLIINKPEWNKNKDNKTFAMFLAENNVIVPEEFYHNS